MSRGNRKSKQYHEWQAAIPDYGADAGIGSSGFPERKLMVWGVKPGQEAAFMAALMTMNDAASRRLRAKADAPASVWDRELRSWVRKRLARGIDVPDSIRWEMRAA